MAINKEFVKTVVESIGNYLKIPPCDITFLEMEGMYKNVAGLYVDDKYIININTSVVEKFNDMELTALLIHEMRHAYQHLQIKDSSSSHEKKEVLSKWRMEIADYKDAGQYRDQYLTQSIEIDAIAFTAFFVEKFFKMNLLMPEIIKEEVIKRIDEISVYYK